MSFRTTRRLAAALALVGLAACSTTEPEPEPAPAQPITPGINLTALSRICPKAMLDDDQTFKRIYSPSSSDDADDLAYQVSLSEYTRTCSVAPSGDQLLLQVAVAGRLIGGPKASPGTYKVPVHVELVDGSVALYDQVITQEVELPAEGLSTQFLFKADNIPVPPTAGENTRVRVGVN
ncbi:hypothetical protein [Martelella mangrovi]|uniref:Lipoprotein n=1 Tax=Martelella mangrovi TaxID=1397477 RepID=A0ABV2IFE6_9HYPH|nr:hypothetical protein [uncultured Martelella sp.]